MDGIFLGLNIPKGYSILATYVYLHLKPLDTLTKLCYAYFFASLSCGC